MLTKEKIVSNAKMYFGAGNKHKFMTEELMNFLGAEFVVAPASTHKQHNNAFEGGLIDHLLRVTTFASKDNDSLPEENQVNKDSLIKVCLLHQIGKARMYKVNESEWHKTNQGKMYDYNEENIAMSVGERSVFYALSNGVTLTEDECQAILNYNKPDTDKQAKHFSSPLAILLRHGSEKAIMIEQARQKKAAAPAVPAE